MPITKLNSLSCITTAKALSHHTQKNAIARTTHWVRATIVDGDRKQINTRSDIPSEAKRTNREISSRIETNLHRMNEQTKLSRAGLG